MMSLVLMQLGVRDCFGRLHRYHATRSFASTLASTPAMENPPPFHKLVPQGMLILIKSETYGGSVVLLQV